MADVRLLRHLSALRGAVDAEARFEAAQIEQLKSDSNLESLEQQGLCYLNLLVAHEGPGLFGRWLVVFARNKETRPFMRCPFGSGDVLTLQPGRGQVDSAPSGTVLDVRSGEIRVLFEDTLPEWAAAGAVRLELMASEFTFSRMRRSIEIVSQYADTATVNVPMDVQRVARLASLIMVGGAESIAKTEQNGPSDNAVLAIKAHYGLNDRQSLALFNVVDQTPPCFLLHGPPGTGKTKTLAAMVHRLVRTSGSKRPSVLLCATSNAAVDVLVEAVHKQGIHVARLGHPARVDPKVVDLTMDAQIANHPKSLLAGDLRKEARALFASSKKQKDSRGADRFAQAREERIRGKELLGEVKKLEREAEAMIAETVEVFAATLSLCDQGILAKRTFDWVVVDEATQALEPMAYWAFLKGKHVVLAGDHQQLGPVVRSPEAQQAGLGAGLFERLMTLKAEVPHVMLNEQYRMHPDIMAFPSAKSYAGQLLCARSGPYWSPSTASGFAPMMFLDTAGAGLEESVHEYSESLINLGEAKLITFWYESLTKHGLLPDDIAIIATYRAQVDYIEERLRNVSEPLPEIDTVDAFQGREKEAVLVSCVRSNAEGRIGFLKESRRANVAITRAKSHLFLVGDSATLSADPYWCELIEFITTQGGYRSVWDFAEGALLYTVVV